MLRLEMTNYTFSKEAHTAKIKTGLETAKKKGKKLGRPKGGKIKGEDIVIMFYTGKLGIPDGSNIITRSKMSHSLIAEEAGISKSTVQKIINKYKQNEN